MDHAVCDAPNLLASVFALDKKGALFSTPWRFKRATHGSLADGLSCQSVAEPPATGCISDSALDKRAKLERRWWYLKTESHE